MKKSINHVLNGKVVWITGSSTGIGLAMAEYAARSGAHVVISALEKNDVYQAWQRCQAYGGDHLAIPLDVVDAIACLEAYQQIMTKYGRVDWLINNAGITHRSSVLETTEDMDDQIFAVNYKAPVRLTKLVLPDMLLRRQGTVVMISSIVGLVGTQQRSSYAATKSALHLWANSLRAEVEPRGLKVKVVFPGFVKTNITKSALLPNGEVYGKVDAGQENAMSAENFAELTWKKLLGHHNYIVIGGMKDKVGSWLGRLAPELLYKVIQHVKVT